MMKKKREELTNCLLGISSDKVDMTIPTISFMFAAIGNSMLEDMGKPKTINPLEVALVAMCTNSALDDHLPEISDMFTTIIQDNQVPKEMSVPEKQQLSKPKKPEIKKKKSAWNRWD